ncbi:MAG: transporter [Bacteroidales bacterium]|nr:transporter [Bacteroidales bacterium]
MARLRPFVLPIAIVLGLLAHNLCSRMAFLIPYLIFTILFLTFTAVDIRKLKVGGIDLWLMFFQVVIGVGSYLTIRSLGGNNIIAEGVMMGAMTPVAASVTVISCLLGANRETVTTYTIVGNLMVAIVAPGIFTAIGVHPELSFAASFLLIFRRIASTLALPFITALLLQWFCPKVNAAIAQYNGVSFYVWAVALLLTLGQTINFIFLHGEGNWGSIAWLAGLSLGMCALQFAVGRLIGRHYGDAIGGGQLLGQKNSAIGIWMSTTFLHPLSSVFMAFYSIYQNLFNSYQMAHIKK